MSANCPPRIIILSMFLTSGAFSASTLSCCITLALRWSRRSRAFLTSGESGNAFLPLFSAYSCVSKCTSACSSQQHRPSVLLLACHLKFFTHFFASDCPFSYWCHSLPLTAGSSNSISCPQGLHLAVRLPLLTQISPE